MHIYWDGSRYIAMSIPVKLYADFNNADAQGRVRLTTNGTLDDLAKYQITLNHGLEVILNDNSDLETIGIVEYSAEEKIWVARIDWDQL